jgi:hypothetical protein
VVLAREDAAGDQRKRLGRLLGEVEQDPDTHTEPPEKDLSSSVSSVDSV